MRRLRLRIIVLLAGMLAGLALTVVPASAVPPLSDDELCLFGSVGPWTPIPGGPAVPYVSFYKCVPAP